MMKIIVFLRKFFRFVAIAATAGAVASKIGTPGAGTVKKGGGSATLDSRSLGTINS